jgi:hypothetical protein
MHEEPTTVIIQRYLDAGAGATRRRRRWPWSGWSWATGCGWSDSKPSGDRLWKET